MSDKGDPIVHDDGHNRYIVYHKAARCSSEARSENGRNLFVPDCSPTNPCRLVSLTYLKCVGDAHPTIYQICLLYVDAIAPDLVRIKVLNIRLENRYGRTSKSALSVGSRCRGEVRGMLRKSRHQRILGIDGVRLSW
jgi:hypothetical protein